jgi:hypothetical protein
MALRRMLHRHDWSIRPRDCISTVPILRNIINLKLLLTLVAVPGLSRFLCARIANGCSTNLLSHTMRLSRSIKRKVLVMRPEARAFAIPANVISWIAVPAKIV